MSHSNKEGLWRVTLDTNPDFCNLNCIMCEDHSPYAESMKERKTNGTLRPIMDKKLVEKVIRESASLGVKEIIPSTMGEPLLYPYFDDILSLCHELNLSLNLTTNGTFPSSEKYQNVEYWAKRICPIGSDVKISWNGATAKTHEKVMLGSSFDEQINNIKRFITVRDQVFGSEEHYCSVTMQLTFLETNLDEIPEMVRLAIKLGIDRVKGHHLWAHFNEIEGESLRRNILAVERWNRAVRECIDITKTHNSNTEKPLKLDKFFELNPSELDSISKDGKCPFLSREAWVDPNGRFNVCCAPDKQRSTLGDFGNLTDSSLADLFSSHQYKHLVNNYMDNDLCKGCNMRRPEGS